MTTIKLHYTRYITKSDNTGRKQYHVVMWNQIDDYCFNITDAVVSKPAFKAMDEVLKAAMIQQSELPKQDHDKGWA